MNLRVQKINFFIRIFIFEIFFKKKYRENYPGDQSHSKSLTTDSDSKFLKTELFWKRVSQREGYPRTIFPVDSKALVFVKEYDLNMQL